MRVAALALILLNATGQRACESSTTAEVDAPAPVFASAAVDLEAKGPPVFTSARVDVDAPPPVVTVDAAAAHGGTIVQAGPHPVEVVAQESGEVYAYPPTSVEAPARATMAVEVPVAGRERPQKVPMRWHPEERRYVGTVGRTTIVPGPVAVSYTVGGHPYAGHVAYVGVVPVVVDAHAPIVVVDAPLVHLHGKHKKHKRFKHGKHRGWGWGHWHGPPGHHPGGPPGHRRHGGHGHGGHGGKGHGGHGRH